MKETDHLYRNGFDKYKQLADKQMKQIMSQRYDWSIFDHDEYRYRKITGTTMLLNAYGRVNKCGLLYIVQKVQEQVDTVKYTISFDTNTKLC